MCEGLIGPPERTFNYAEVSGQFAPVRELGAVELEVMNAFVGKMLFQEVCDLCLCFWFCKAKHAGQAVQLCSMLVVFTIHS